VVWAGLKQGSRTGYPAAYHRTHGIRYFHGCYSLAMISVGMTRRRTELFGV
jgi:hypothetical protein